MSSSGVVYARVPPNGVLALEKAVREARAVGQNGSPLGVLAFDPEKHAFAVVDRWGSGDDMPSWAEDPDLASARELCVLSAAVGDVVAFFDVDEGTELGYYGTWRDGELVRELQWAGGRWEKVEGEPQPWEAALFDPASLARALEYPQGTETEIRATYSTGQLTEGARWPVPDAAAIPIRTFLRAPAYGFDPWPRRSAVVDLNRAEDG